MWKVLRRAHSIAISSTVIAVAALSMGGGAYAQSTFINQNTTGINLPGVQLPQGSDEVRAADGTTCRSAISGSGAYLDVGLIGNPEQSNVDSSFSAYTRIVVPLDSKRGRIDCRRLYDLEIRRLEIELKLVELGLNRGIAPVSETVETRAFTGDDDGTQNAVAGATADDAISDETIKVAQQSSGKNWAEDGWTTDGRAE
ncbi:MAG: hypothetical protein AAF423_08470 [Pseudomonadota bacterium]